MKKNTLRYFLEIENHSGYYEMLIHQGDRNRGQRLSELKLGPDASLTIKGQPYSLASITRKMTLFEPEFLKSRFDERGQLELGEYLYEQTFGPLPLQPPIEAPVQLRIITKDVHIATLPWYLIACKGIFLCAAGWSVMLSENTECFDIMLPAAPRVLIALNEAYDEPETGAEKHLQHIKNILNITKSPFEVARSWEEFEDKTKNFKPHIFYYYGYAEGDLYTPHLIFRTKNMEKQRISISEVIRCFGSSKEEKPLLAYINCLRGDPFAMIGAGQQLHEYIPAVISNRTIFYIEASKAQAKEFFKAVLLEDASPHQAILNMYIRLGNMQLIFEGARWMKPMLHCNYDIWKYGGAALRELVGSISKIEVSESAMQISEQISNTFKNMLEQNEIQSPVCLLYCKKNAEHEEFHHNLKRALSMKTDNFIYEIRPLWPDEFWDPARSFEDMICYSFKAGSFDNLTDIIQKSCGDGNCIFLVRHEALRDGSFISPSVLKSYFKWWDQKFMPKLSAAGAFGFLTVSFVLDEPENLYGRFMSRLKNIRLNRTKVSFYDLASNNFRADTRLITD